LELNIKHEHQGSVLSVSGDVDMYSSPKLREGVIEAVSNAAGKLVAHVSEVTYIDSSGVAVLIDALKRCTAKKMPFILAEPSKAVLDVIDLALLNDVFDIKESLEDALS